MTSSFATRPAIARVAAGASMGMGMGMGMLAGVGKTPAQGVAVLPPRSPGPGRP